MINYYEIIPLLARRYALLLFCTFLHSVAFLKERREMQFISVHRIMSRKVLVKHQPVDLVKQFVIVLPITGARDYQKK